MERTSRDPRRRVEWRDKPEVKKPCCAGTPAGDQTENWRAPTRALAGRRIFQLGSDGCLSEVPGTPCALQCSTCCWRCCGPVPLRLSLRHVSLSDWSLWRCVVRCCNSCFATSSLRSRTSLSRGRKYVCFTLVSFDLGGYRRRKFMSSVAGP